MECSLVILVVVGVEFYPFAPNKEPNTIIPCPPRGKRAGYVSPRRNDSQKMTSTAVALLEDILQYDPNKRISAHQALNSPYLAPYHQSADEPAADGLFDWPYEVELPLAVWRAIMYVPEKPQDGDVWLNDG